MAHPGGIRPVLIFKPNTHTGASHTPRQVSGGQIRSAAWDYMRVEGVFKCFECLIKDLNVFVVAS